MMRLNSKQTFEVRGFFKSSFWLLLTLLSISSSYSQKNYIRFEERGYAGIKLPNGKRVVQPTFESLGWSDGKFEVINGLTGYQQNGLWGILTVSGEIRVPAKYHRLTCKGSETLEAGMIQTNGKYKEGVINFHGKVIFPFEYEQVEIQNEKIIFGSGAEFGLANSDGTILLKPAWRSIKSLTPHLFLVENINRKKALFDLNGYPKSEFILDSARVINPDEVICHVGPQIVFIHQKTEFNKSDFFKAARINQQSQTEVLPFTEWIIYDSANQIIGSVKADSLKSYDPGVIDIYRNGWRAQISNNLKEPLIENFIPLIQSDAIISVKKGKAGYGMTDEKGSFKINPNYQQIDWNGRNAILTECATDGHCTDQLTFPAEGFRTSPAVDRISRFKNYFKIYNYGRFGLWDSAGREVLPIIYDSIFNVEGQVIHVNYLGRTGLMTFGQKWIVGPQFAPITLINDQRYIVHSIGDHGLYDITGNKLYRSVFELTLQPDGTIREFLPGNISRCILPDGKYCLSDKNDFKSQESGSKLKDKQNSLAEKTNHVPPFPETEGLKGFFENEKFGFKDAKGRIRIANRYDSIRPFREGRAAIKLLGKWGFIDQNDHLHVQPLFQKVSDYNEKVAVVKMDNKWGMIDLTGILKLQPIFDEISPQINSTFSVVRIKNLHGLISTKGQLLIEPRFEFLLPTFKNQILVKNHFYGVITTQGVPVVPLIHRQLKWLPGFTFYFSEKSSDWQLLNDLNKSNRG